jgi:SAM-dependent methyltransferase
MVSSEIERMYDTGDYHQDHFSFYFPGLEQRLVDDYLEDVRRVEAMLPERPRVLDVGCADGLFLARLPSRFEKHGVDISRPAVEKGAKQHGLHLVCGDLVDKATINLFEESMFDLITLWSILEHVQDPCVAIKQVARLLKRGGLVMIRVPNADGLLNSVARALYRLSFGRVRRPLAYFYTRLHIYNFGAGQLRRLLESCGFRVMQVFYDERYVTKHALPYLPWRLAGPLRVLKVMSRLLQRRDFITVCAVRR